MALYRKYRPASFAEVVGQEQVTQPLSAALDSGRINHAYLFSGPRGCGKTSSARILARSLNCEQGPTSTPCGVCNSCTSLAPGGPGNLDVTELDAASHNGVEDMRELRDRAFYAPAESRYRVFIIDEAHMITNAGSNALLKIVEEPPAHLIFIFATTEPEKVIGTIRSRTHHYPFRLLTPLAMRGLLERTVHSEGVHVDDAVYPLVIRAGGGSPRDSLSILDQLLAGAGPEGLSYERALPLLGVTDASLIDAAILALATKDKAGMFTTIDHVIEAGHDPRRFTTDLLDRLRDLMVLQAVPEALELGLVDAPTDRAEILIQQAAMFSGNELAGLASMVNNGIDDMRGATSPRLLLEILSARLLLANTSVATLPVVEGTAGAAPTSTSGVSAAAAARAKAREYAQKKESQPAVSQPAPTPPQPQPTPTPAPEPTPAPLRQVEPTPAPTPPQPQPTPTPAPEPTSAPVRQPEPQQQAPVQAPAPAPAPKPAPKPTPVPVEDLAETIRSQWAQLRSIISERSTRTGIMLTEARVLGLREETLVLGHTTGALANRLNDADHNDIIMAVLQEELGRKLQVECVVGTDPAVAGFQQQPKRNSWNPNAKPQPAPAAEPEEPERPAPQTGWGQPVKLGGTPTPAPAPAPVVEPTPAPVQQSPAEKPSWRERAEQAAAHIAQQKQDRQGSSAPFEKGVPLPPEPDDLPPDPYDYPPDEGIPERAPQAPQAPQPPAAMPAAVEVASTSSLSEEEELIQEAAAEPGELDRRDAKTIAIELLAQELGAKPL
ncbi:DNA polymerase III subunit gamma and tau [Corynebacterium callunae]|uniref:DNA polymerase III subunit gamma and tau n=1 Tax=Corynebacterium callunae TaxID=1721 RepID=UPI003981E460